MLHNICARAKGGKTEYIYNVAKKLMDEKRHTFLIVPEQGAVITEREIIKRLGNASNEYIEVINFKRLCNRVFRETGGLTQNYVDSARKMLIMSKAAENVKELLCEYKASCENKSFITKALSTVSEFQNYGIKPSMLEKCAESPSLSKNNRLSAKLRDFSLLYAEYSHLLTSKFGYTDSSDDLDRLCSVICDTHFFRGKTVIIDSFYGFTVPELNIIQNIICDAQDVYITYLLDKNHKNFLFERGEKAFEKICMYAENCSAESENIYLSYDGAYKSKTLSALEKNFCWEHTDKGKTYTEKIESDGAVRIISCENPYEEARLCAAAVKYLTARGAKYSDISICARSISEYTGLIDTELKREGIPFSFGIKYDLLSRPVISYITSAFEFSKTLSKQSVLRHIKSGLTLLSDEEADLTECYIRTWNIQGRMFTETEWLMNPDGYISAEEMSERARDTLETVENARVKLITPLEVFSEEIKSAECANDISMAIVRLLSSGKYSKDSLSDDEITYHNMLMDALDCISDIIGNESISPKKYAELLELILSLYDTGKIPGTIDEVNIADAELLRCSETKYMIVLGLCDGNFPRTPTNDGIFSDREKMLIAKEGVDLSGTCADKAYDELFLAYKVITSPTKGLFLMYSENGITGEENSESCIISYCKSALDGILTENGKDAFDLILSLSDKGLYHEAFRSTSPEMQKVLADYLSAKGIQIKKEQESETFALSPECAKKVFGENMLLSPSRLEKFNYCACSYFGTYTLDLRPEAVAKLGPSESGNIVHKILEILICELSEKKQNGEEITVEYALEREKQLLSDYVNALIGGEKAKKNLSARFKYLYSRLSGALDTCVMSMTNELINSEFVQKDFELSIGTSTADVPFSSIPIEAPDGKVTGTLTLVGKVDRTDIYKKNGKTYIKVVDYKTGTKTFNMSDVASGINLQMLLYLYSLTKNCGTRYGDGEVLPAGVLYTPVHRPAFSCELGEDAASDSKCVKANGILIDDKEILSAMEKGIEGKFIPVKLKKDGSFYSYSSVTTLATMGKILDTAAKVASKLAYEMQSGKILKNPYKCDINSCTYCDMAAFCRYEKGESTTRYAMTKYSDEVFEKSTGGGDSDAV